MKLVSVLLAASCLLSAVSARSLETTRPAALSRPGFDPKDIVRRVRQSHAGGPMHGVDDGEFLLDTNRAWVPCHSGQWAPAVAFDGTNFLVVWEDYRNGEDDIYGCRVTPQGTVLDASGIAICTVAAVKWAPSVAFDGASFLVVWQDQRSGLSDIYGGRVTPQGAVLDPAGIPISTAPNEQWRPKAAFDGASFLVVWEDGRGYEYDIYACRVTPQGAVLDSSGIAVSAATSGQYKPAVAFDGANCLVVWEDCRSGDPGIYGCRVTPQGTVLEPQGIAISTAASQQSYPAIAFDSANFLVVWTDGRNDELDIYGARVTPAGTVLEPAGIAISTAAGDQWSPVVAFDGANSLVLWEDERSGSSYDIYGARVTPQGAVLEPQGIAVSVVAGDQRSPSVASDGQNLAVVWEDYRSGSFSDIYGCRVTPQGTVLEPQGIAISISVYNQWSPAAACDGTNFLVAWDDYRNGEYDIYGCRVTPQGTVLDPAGIAVSTAAHVQRDPSVAFDGTNFLVVWEDWRGGDTSDIYGCRVTPQGAVLDSGGIAISTAACDQKLPKVTSDNSGSLVVWEDWRGDLETDIYGCRVTPAGVVLDPSGIAISAATYDQLSPAVAFDGVNHFVVWQDSRSNMYDIYGCRVTPQGAVLDPSGIAICTVAAIKYFPTVAFDDANSLVLWSDRRSGEGYDIYGCRVTSQGAVLDPSGFAVSQAGNDELCPELVFDGANSLVVWTDESHGEWDLYGCRVTSQGTVFDSGSVVTQEGIQWSPALARGGGSAFLAYEGWTGMVGGKQYNTERIWGKMNPNPGVAESPNAEVRMTNSGATIVRGVLVLGAVGGRQHSAYRAELLDITGRTVLELKAGANDVRALAPGVYFVRRPETEDGRPDAAIQKVVVTR
jgi:phosphoribosylformylglycinamidine (FGAM) synthase PurS component